MNLKFTNLVEFQVSDSFLEKNSGLLILGPQITWIIWLIQEKGALQIEVNLGPFGEYASFFRFSQYLNFDNLASNKCSQEDYVSFHS